ncbi:MAG: CrcB family protein [Pseudomonadota bacterium]
MIEKLVLVAMGGALGACLRFASVSGMVRLTGESFWGTLFVNVVGSFVMGVLVVLFLERITGETNRMAVFALTGVLGGFTTFSAFSMDAMRLFEQGRGLTALSYVGGSVLLSLFALLVGVLSARALAV